MSEAGGERVLVVEDDEDTREALVWALSHEGFVVEAAPDGERGLELARSWHPDVVLVDLLMPRLSGTDVAAALGRDPVLRRVPVVSMSASPVELAPPTASRHVPKPFGLAEVIGALREALRAARGASR